MPDSSQQEWFPVLVAGKGGLRLDGLGIVLFLLVSDFI